MVCQYPEGRPIPVEGRDKDNSIEYINQLSKAYKINFDKDGIKNIN